jgi:hypothetical protein
MNWLDRIIKNFFEFKPARSSKCRAHSYIHYRDEVRVTPLSSRYYLHNNLIAKLSKLNDVYVLDLTNAEFNTKVTIRRLNAILSYLKHRLGIHHDITFNLKYSTYGGTPIATYVSIGGKTYEVNHITLIYSDKLLHIDLELDKEIKYFKDHKELNSIKRLYSKILSIQDKINQFIESYRTLTMNLDTYEKYNKLRYSYVNDLMVRFTKFRITYGLIHHGVFANNDVGMIRELLKQFLKEYRWYYEQFKILFTEDSILSI